MKIISAVGKNFGSYKEAKLDLTPQGLTLIQGATGSGKSTLCDLVPWVLFGITSKNGSVDEIINWQAEGPTEGTITLEDSTTIYRSRKPNDLWFAKQDGTVQRGKDLADTQKLINNILRLNADTFLAGSYFHEFSQTAQFFITNAKNRRLICEQIADLDKAKNLQASAKSKLKEIQDKLKTTEAQVSKLQGAAESLLQQLENANNNQKTWKPKEYSKEELSLIENEPHIRKSLELHKKLRDKSQKALAVVLSQKCPTCGGPKKSDKAAQLHQEITDFTQRINSYSQDLIRINGFLNVTTENPYDKVIISTLSLIDSNTTKLDKAQSELTELNAKVLDYDLLATVLDNYRASLITNSITQLQNNTNKLLNDHFDSEINVQFEVSGADKLEVVITKDGNIAAYTQLSKGQRQLLKLCFSVAVMRAVQNQSGVGFNTLYFDEALDGMDSNFKVKSYRLFEQLALDYENVFVVEHSTELKELFTNKITVVNNNGNSEIEKS